MVEREQLRRWRLVLGREAQAPLSGYGGAAGLSLNSDESAMDEALAAIYDETRTLEDESPRAAGLGSSAPRLARWLGEIRTYFTTDVVSVIQGDAIERKGLTQLLMEPETLKSVQPEIGLVATLLTLRGRIPERSKDAARQLVKAVVEQINRRLENSLRQAVAGALSRRHRSLLPSAARIDWQTTIRRNLKHYHRDYKTIVPERFYFFGRARRHHEWTVILDLDQSGSMAESVIFGSVVGSICASISALKTRVVAFDTNVVDLTEACGNDPVEMLFGIQLGGGTDIDKSVAYCQEFVTDPARTIFILLSDLYEGGNQASLIQRLDHLHASGVKVVCLLALSDRGAPAYNEALARRLAGLGIPCFACTPNLLPEFLEGALKGFDLPALAARIGKAGRGE